MSFPAGWSDLPPEILLSISQRLYLADVIRLRATCYCWAWALGKACRRHLCPPSPPSVPIFQPSPWLLFPSSPDENANFCTFLSLSQDRCYKISSLPQIAQPSFMGSSSEGWLITVDPHFTPRLLNPLTRKELSLPSLFTLHKSVVPIYSPADGSLSGGFCDDLYEPLGIETFSRMFCQRHLRKIILTSSPLRGGIAIAFCQLHMRESFLAFATAGDDAWAPILNFEQIEDVVYRKGDGKLYALTIQGAVYVLECDKNRLWGVVSMVAGCIDDRAITHRRRYLIFSSGELLQVTRDIQDEFQTYTNNFKVFRFDHNCHIRHEQRIRRNNEIESDPRLCPYGSCWVPVEDLGDRSLFVGANDSFSLHCADELWLKRNRVYFTDDMPFKLLHNLDREVGMFDLKSGEIEYIFPPDCCYNWPPPLWFMPAPSLWDEGCVVDVKVALHQ